MLLRQPGRARLRHGLLSLVLLGGGLAIGGGGARRGAAGRASLWRHAWPRMPPKQSDGRRSAFRPQRPLSAADSGCCGSSTSPGGLYYPHSSTILVAAALGVLHGRRCHGGLVRPTVSRVLAITNLSSGVGSPPRAALTQCYALMLTLYHTVIAPRGPLGRTLTAHQCQ